MPNEMGELKEGMNCISCPTWGDMHIFVRDGNIHAITVFNAKKVSCKTKKANNSGRISSHYVKLELATEVKE
jgi:hypothetical protein